MLARREGALDRRRERRLLAARLVLGVTDLRERPFERPAGSEHILHPRNPTGANGRSPTVPERADDFGMKVRNLRDSGGSRS